MELRDMILLLHPIFAVIVVFPLLGIVVNRALRTHQRRLQTEADGKSNLLLRHDGGTPDDFFAGHPTRDLPRQTQSLAYGSHCAAFDRVTPLHRSGHYGSPVPPRGAAHLARTLCPKTLRTTVSNTALHHSGISCFSNIPLKIMRSHLDLLLSQRVPNSPDSLNQPRFTLLFQL